VEGVERPQELDIQAGFFSGFAQTCLDGGLPLFHTATPCFPLARRFIFAHSSFQEQDVAISFEKKTHDDLKPSAHVRPRLVSVSSVGSVKVGFRSLLPTEQR
jgi:hypothetical protein